MLRLVIITLRLIYSAFGIGVEIKRKTADKASFFNKSSYSNTWVGPGEPGLPIQENGPRNQKTHRRCETALET